MTPKMWWRAAAGLTAVFAVAHTAGMLPTADQVPDERALLDHMRAYRLEIMGASRTYWDFYFGFGLLLTASLLLMAALSWVAATLSETDARVAAKVGWPLFGGQAVVAVVCWAYFFLAPAVMTSAAAVCTLLALVGGGHRRPAVRAGRAS